MAASAQAVRHVWRSDCQQISAHPSERNASWSPPPPVGPPVVVPPSPVAPTVIVSTALMYRGIQYRNGGSDPSCFDCSGFVQWVFAQNGIQLPREVHDQYVRRGERFTASYWAMRFVGARRIATEDTKTN